MIDKATVQKIKDTADIVEVVSDYVHLTRRGANYMGLCPFHNERTPSFSVNRRRNFCYCFSCHKGGSPVNFIMEKEGISYHDALLHLAKKYGIKVEERELTDEERQLATERERLLVAAEWAGKQMEQNLRNTEEGRDVGLTYLYHRGVTDDAIRTFHLGYAIEKGSPLTKLMLNAGFDLETLRALGLTGKSQSGNLYDKYYGRVIFPIMNPSGKVVGFGGRDLKGGSAKYINSPESVLYHKNNELYGIFQAKGEIVRQNKCFLVEGYLDVISMWQSGMQNTVASSGTALTDGQIAVIHRFTENITLLYDGDAAGIKAALRGINMLLSHKMKVTVLLLPDGDDPDSFAKKHTPEEFRQYVEEHETDIIRFKMQVLMKDAGNNPMKRAEAINSVVESVAHIADDVVRTVYVGECSRILNIDEASVASAVAKARYSILEQQRREREQNRLRRDYPENEHGDNKSNHPNLSPAETLQTNTTPNLQVENQGVNNGVAQGINAGVNSDLSVGIKGGVSRGVRGGVSQVANPLMPVEKKIVELLVRYGYMECIFDDEEDKNADSSDENTPGNEAENEGIYTIADFISDEMEADKVSFTVPQYQKVYDALMQKFDDYFADYDGFLAQLEDKLNEEQRKGEADIAANASSIDSIRREENKLNDKLRDMRAREIRDFSRLYPGDFLASHEDNEIRMIANEMINEKYVLSNIYKKQGASEEFDYVRGVIRALTEWKSEILNIHLRQLMDELKTYVDDETKANETMAKISKIMAMRSQVAKDIGDRVLGNRI